MKPHPQKVTGRLFMNKPVESDFASFFKIHADPLTNLFNPAGPMSEIVAIKTFETWLEHWRTYCFGPWTIRAENNGEIIGFGGLDYKLYTDVLHLNLGYRLAATAWGKGYATELATFSIQYAFKVLQKREVFAIVRPKHLTSIKVLEKCGMLHIQNLADVPGEESSLVYCIYNN